MSLLVHVQNGTGAGTKRPLLEQVRGSWRCVACRGDNPQYATRCLVTGCNAKRATS